MLLNTEELLALANGDVDPDRLAVLLDRLEQCPDSARALQVLVTLKANREEALAALRKASGGDAPAPVPFPHPTAPPAPTAGWVTQGLRWAATIAVVGILGVWAADAWFVGTSPVTELATQEYINVIRPSVSATELTSDAAAIASAERALGEHDYAEARRLLTNVPYDSDGYVPLYLGMAHYFLKDYEAAATTLRQIQDMPEIEDSGVRYQAMWYEANALLALGRPLAALPLLEAITTAPSVSSFDFTARAKTTFDTLCDLLGINHAASE